MIFWWWNDWLLSRRWCTFLWNILIPQNYIPKKSTDVKYVDPKCQNKCSPTRLFTINCASNLFHTNHKNVCHLLERSQLSYHYNIITQCITHSSRIFEKSTLEIVHHIHQNTMYFHHCKCPSFWQNTSLPVPISWRDTDVERRLNDGSYA